MPGSLPVVIWLHPLSYCTGYSRIARPRVAASLTKRGFAVLAFDQIGFGARVLDAARFYERYPAWSLMGKMVADTRAALDSVGARYIDPIGSTSSATRSEPRWACSTAALDGRVKALAAVAGFDPLRLDTRRRTSRASAITRTFTDWFPVSASLRDTNTASRSISTRPWPVAPRAALLVAPDQAGTHRWGMCEGKWVGAAHLRAVGPRTRCASKRPSSSAASRGLQEQVFDWLASVR